MAAQGRIQRLTSHAKAFANAFGAMLAAQWFITRVLRKLGVRGKKVLKVQPPGASYPLRARIWGSSDMDAMKMIFLDQEYAPLQSIGNVRIVMDLGANVGYSSVYFLNCYPNARVFAVEPDSSNFELCCKNLAPYGTRAARVQGAAWSECTHLSFGSEIFGDGREWSVHVARQKPGESASVEAWDIVTLMEKASARELDLLKIDIEGAEIELFDKSSPQWLARVRNLCIELHGPECSRKFYDAMQAFDYDHEISGELAICKNIRLKGNS